MLVVGDWADWILLETWVAKHESALLDRNLAMQKTSLRVGQSRLQGDQRVAAERQQRILLVECTTVLATQGKVRERLSMQGCDAI